MKSFNTFTEEFASPEDHPLHSAALGEGFHHVNSSSMAGIPSHEYNHRNGHRLMLHTNQGNPSFRLTTRSGNVTNGDTAMKLKGAMFGAEK
jgi:hypothetical protein